MSPHDTEGPLRGRMPPSLEIAAAVARARAARGWTQRRLAQALGTSNTAVSRIESGRHGMSVATLQRLADVLGVRFTIAPRRVPLSAIDRSEIRRAILMSDHEREAYYLASNRNMLLLFRDATHSS
ncbi:MAG TPA: helix-turn-helix domain-containing protein [Candidatus Limnocylindrales bacterium]|nr:helix-turn-helix domain-containing protein [Candidatus Limnocylindrales bacterium]